MTPKPAGLKRRDDLQILRAVAVVLVVLYHLEAPFFQNGFLGVDIFFVISGYLMALLYNRTSTSGFYARRIDRLLGAYCFAIALTAVAGFVILVPTDFSQLFEQSLASLLFAPNFHFWNQTSYFEKAAFRPLLNLWSLGVEAQFYLIVPFLYRAIHPRRSWFFCVLLLSFAACLGVQLISPKTSFFMMPLRIWEFLFGAGVAWYVSSASLRKPSVQLAALQYSVLLALVAFVLLVPIVPESRTVMLGHPGFAAFAVCALTALLIMIGMPNRLEQSFGGRVLVKIGDYSYSVYLVHFPAIVLWNYVEFGGTRLGVDTFPDAVGMLSIIAALSLVSYYFVERRGAAYLKSSVARVAVLMGAAMVLVGSNAANRGRYDEQELKIFAAPDDRGAYRCGKVFRLMHPFARICGLSRNEFKNRVLLVGDSHADALKDELTNVAAEKKASVFFYARNNPLKKYGYEVVINDAITLGADAIILHFENKIYKSADWTNRFKRLVESASERKIRVIVIAPVPSYSAHVPRELYYAASGRSELEIAIDRKAHLVDTSAFTLAIDKYDDQAIAVFDPSEWLCPPSTGCQLADDSGKALYFDTNHLTLTGANALRPMFEKLVDRAIAR